MILQLMLGIVTVCASTDQIDDANPSMSSPEEEDEGVSLLQYKMHVLPRKLADEATGTPSGDTPSTNQSSLDAIFEGLITLLAFVCTTCVGGAVGRLRQAEFNTWPQILQLVCGRVRR